MAGFGLRGSGKFVGARGFVGTADGLDECVGGWCVRVCGAAELVLELAKRSAARERDFSAENRGRRDADLGTAAGEPDRASAGTDSRYGTVRCYDGRMACGGDEAARHLRCGGKISRGPRVGGFEAGQPSEDHAKRLELSLE